MGFLHCWLTFWRHGPDLSHQWKAGGCGGATPSCNFSLDALGTVQWLLVYCLSQIASGTDNRGGSFTDQENSIFIDLWNFCDLLCFQEEVLPLRRTLRGLYPRRAPCHEAKGEVWAKEAAGAVVPHSRCVQVRKDSPFPSTFQQFPVVKMPKKGSEPRLTCSHCTYSCLKSLKIILRKKKHSPFVSVPFQYIWCHSYWELHDLHPDD